jgi:hypothetical protein
LCIHFNRSAQRPAAQLRPQQEKHGASGCDGPTSTRRELLMATRWGTESVGRRARVGAARRHDADAGPTRVGTYRCPTDGGFERAASVPPNKRGLWSNDRKADRIRGAVSVGYVTDRNGGRRRAHAPGRRIAPGATAGPLSTDAERGRSGRSAQLDAAEVGASRVPLHVVAAEAVDVARYSTEFDGLGGFDVALLDEATVLAVKLRERSAARPGPQNVSAEQRALELRSRLASLLTQRMSVVRSAAHFVFRRQPNIVREVTSAYERRCRAAWRRSSETAPAAEPATADATAQ